MNPYLAGLALGLFAALCRERAAHERTRAELRAHRRVVVVDLQFWPPATDSLPRSPLPERTYTEAEILREFQ